ncbi:hypothetical protein WJX84_006303 [Apatococcus fuscideae]|uniref:Profilin n=1 Tax=Apatococcus fuscideae TaxID=2026836 RepID=A0AAW1SUI8_9CHLO
MPPQASGQVHPAEQSYPSAAGFSTAAPSHLMPSESSQGSELRQSAAPGLSAAATSDFQGAAQRILCDCSKVVVFDQQGSILFSTSAAIASELLSLTRLFADRDRAISSGMCVGGQKYEVHKFHPPLMYGRAHNGVDPEVAEGAALHVVERNSLGHPVYIFITYKLPVLSGKAVPQLVQFARQTLQAL